MKKILFGVLLLGISSVLNANDFQYSHSACEMGNAIGCSNLGVMYENGQGVEQNYSRAKELFHKACDGGDSEGCKNYSKLNKL